MTEHRLVAIAELAAHTPNALATGPFGSSIGSKTFRPIGVPVIRGTNLSADVGKRLVEEDFVFIEPELAKRFARSQVTEGDLVFTCWGTINQVGLIDKRAQYDRYVISNKQMKLTVELSKVLPLYVYYWFSSKLGQEQILSGGIGSSVPGFNLGQLRQMRIPLPPLSEQRVIISILGGLDDKIDINRRTNETLEAIARAIFQDWFVDFGPTRAKMEGRAPYFASELWSLFPDLLDNEGKPQGWEWVPAREMVGFNPPEQLMRGQPAHYLDMAALPTAGSWPDAATTRNFASGSRFRRGDTLLARITPCLENGKAAFIQSLDEREVGWGSTEFIVMRARPPMPSAYSYILARDPAFRDRAIQSMTGTSGRQRVQVDSLATFELVKPADDVAKAFGGLISPSFDKIAANADEIEILAATRDLLLPKLMSGEIRVREADKIAEAAQ